MLLKIKLTFTQSAYKISYFRMIRKTEVLQVWLGLVCIFNAYLSKKGIFAPCNWRSATGATQWAFGLKLAYSNRFIVPFFAFYKRSH